MPVIAASADQAMQEISQATIPFLALQYVADDGGASATRLLHTLIPAWQHEDGDIEFTQFTDGITNTLLKAAKRRPGWSKAQSDSDAILIRAYGEGTEVLIDRERETESQLLLAARGLAPPLLARFENGLIYRFIRGRVATPADLAEPCVYRGVASKLGEWHARLPVRSHAQTNGHGDHTDKTNGDSNGLPTPPNSVPSHAEAFDITPQLVTPNIWTIMQRWVLALPEGSDAERAQKELLQTELEQTVDELASLPGLGHKGLVLGHCDLLSGNVILLPSEADRKETTAPNGQAAHNSQSKQEVAFIDYEYTAATPAAFDLANHFAEWGGFQCDYTALPTRHTRRQFLAHYLESYHAFRADVSRPVDDASAFEDDVDELCATVDRFRGVPGLYWGIWALIQATLSHIDFDYASYADLRLGEYWAWRATEAELLGTSAPADRPRDAQRARIRERRWAEDGVSVQDGIREGDGGDEIGDSPAPQAKTEGLSPLPATTSVLAS